MYIWPQALQVRRPVRRCIRILNSTSISSAACNGLFISSSNLSSASACGILRGKPSRIKPFCASLSARRSLIIPRTISSETSCPASMACLALIPRGVPAFTAARSRSPVEIWGMPYFSTSNLAWVPLPPPGAPINTILIIFILHKLGF